MRYLLDSDIIIDYLRGYRPSIEKLQKLIQGGDDLFVSAVTHLELHAGDSITKPETLSQISGLFQKLAVVNVTAGIAGRAGDLRRMHQASVPDALIAASAESVEAAIVTRNIKDFKKIPGLRIEKI